MWLPGDPCHSASGSGKGKGCRNIPLGKEQEGEAEVEASSLESPSLGLDPVSLCLPSLSFPGWEMGLLTLPPHGPHSGHQVGCVSPLRALRVE